MTPVVHYGLGPIGRAVAELVAVRPWLRSVAAVDVDPLLQGRRLATVTGVDAPDSPVVEDSLDEAHLAGGGVALHCTGSSLARVSPQILELVNSGLNVISTTEELSFPWQANRELAETIDAAAREAGVTVLGTGINPGFAMDYLPMTLSAVSQRVTAVEVHRVQDAGTRRVPLQRKVGAGMEPDEFRREVEAGRLGHVGLRESVHALADTFGWTLTDVKESIEPLRADVDTPMAEGTIEPGQVTGIHQRAEAWAGDTRVVSLTLDMAVGIGPTRDHVHLFGSPDLKLEIPGGLPGDTATVAIVVNAIPRVVAAPPGLLVMSQMPPPVPGRPPR
jgi:hypothetical protein